MFVEFGCKKIGYIHTSFGETGGCHARHRLLPKAEVVPYQIIQTRSIRSCSLGGACHSEGAFFHPVRVGGQIIGCMSSATGSAIGIGCKSMPESDAETTGDNSWTKMVKQLPAIEPGQCVFSASSKGQQPSSADIIVPPASAILMYASSYPPVCSQWSTTIPGPITMIMMDSISELMACMSFVINLCFRYIATKVVRIVHTCHLFVVSSAFFLDFFEFHENPPPPRVYFIKNNLKYEK